MKKLIVFFALSLVFTALSQQDDEQGIRDCFANYRAAILNDKGEEAVTYVDTRTIAYYGYILEKTKDADSASLARFSVVDKIMVFTLRHLLSYEELKQLNAQTLFSYAVNSGMIGKNSVVNNAIGKIEIINDFARAEMVINEKPSPIYMHFYKENNMWKTDLTALFTSSDAALEEVIRKSGMTEDDFIMKLLQRTTGKLPLPSIWHPQHD